MKNIRFAIFCLSLALASCTKQENPGLGENNNTIVPPDSISPDELVEITISASYPKVKTSLSDTDSDGVRDDVVWNDGDMISVWDGYANRKFVLIEGAGGTQAKFRGLIYHKATKLYSAYPYTETFMVETPPSDTENQVYGYARILMPSNSVQYAVPGGYDPSSAFAIAESNDPKTMMFTQKTSLLKFRLASDMNNVVSVKFSGNATNDYIWGTVSYRYVANSDIWPGVINRSNINPNGRGKEITLCNKNGSVLQTGVDYYIVVPATTFERGYKLTFVHSDKTESVRSSSKSIEYNTSQIYALASTEISKTMFERYSVDYNKNESLTISGHSAGKSYFGEPIIIKSDQTYTITTGGAYFIEPGAEVTLGITSPANKILIVGDSKYEMSKISMTHSIPMVTGGDLMVLNMDFTFPDIGNNMISNTANIQKLSHISFQNCCLRYDSPKCILHSQYTSVTHIRFYGNDIIFTYDEVPSDVTKSADIALFSSDSSEDVSYETFVFSNNLLYHKGNFNSDRQAFVLALGSSKQIKQVSLDNNTFINLKTRQLVPYYIGGNIGTDGSVARPIYIHNNLFYLPNQGSGAGRIFQSTIEPVVGTNVTKYGVSVYLPADKTFTYSQHSTPGNYIFQSDPFESIDLSNGVFTKGSLLYPESVEIGAKQDRATGKRIRN